MSTNPEPSTINPESKTASARYVPPPPYNFANTHPTSSSPTTDSGLSAKEYSIQKNERNSETSSEATPISTYASSYSRTISLSRETKKEADTLTGAKSLGSSTACGQSIRRGFASDLAGDGESILEEAQRLTHGNRNVDYGHPLDDYTRTAALWSAYLGITISPDDAAVCMALMKFSRQKNRPKRDNMTDAAGYAWVVDEIIEEKKRREAAF
jgi:hypothetical protein